MCCWGELIKPLLSILETCNNESKIGKKSITKVIRICILIKIQYIIIKYIIIIIIIIIIVIAVLIIIFILLLLFLLLLLLLLFLLLSGLTLFPGKKGHNSRHQPVVLGIAASSFFFSFHIPHFPYYSRRSK